MKHIYLIVILLILFICGGCVKYIGEHDPVDFDIDKIKKRGKLIAITGYNSYSYFIYRGQPMGYEYELIKRFADHLGVKLEIKIEKNIDKMINMLNNGEGDIIAYNLTITKERKSQIAFSDYHNLTNQVLVQAKPKEWRNLMQHEIESSLIRNAIDLGNKTIHVRSGSSYKLRLENLQKEIGEEIDVVVAGQDLTTDDLIQMVSEGKIKYTIADENVARLNHIFYNNIDYETQISLSQKVAWAVRRSSNELLKTLNKWLLDIKSTSDYYVIYNKYFKRRNVFRFHSKVELFSTKSGNISEYDQDLKVFSKKLGWDWRLLASLVYQESKFDPTARSWAGAAGLMQLMPSTLEKYNVKDPYDPHENLFAGLQYVQYLDKIWQKYVGDKDERIKMVLASYNIGIGHIMDAYKLAKKHNANPQVWSNNVEDFLLKKSTAKYYEDEVVENGYCRGNETVAFVSNIIERYEHYKRLTDVKNSNLASKSNNKG